MPYILFKRLCLVNYPWIVSGFMAEVEVLLLMREFKDFCRWLLSGENKHNPPPSCIVSLPAPPSSQPLSLHSLSPHCHNVVVHPNQIMWFNVRLWWSCRSCALITQIKWWLLFDSVWTYWLIFDRVKVNLSHGYCLPQMTLVGALSFNSVVLKWP